MAEATMQKMSEGRIGEEGYRKRKEERGKEMKKWKENITQGRSRGERCRQPRTEERNVNSA